jgi:hypothetical protein
MAKNIILTEVAEKSIREFVSKRILEIDKELERITELKDERKSLLATIDQLDSAVDGAAAIDPNYQSSWTWINKAKHIVFQNGGHMTTRAIVDEIILREPGMDRKKAISGISSVLSTSKEFMTGKNERGEKTYSMPMVEPDDDFSEDFDEQALQTGVPSRKSVSQPLDDLPF